MEKSDKYFISFLTQFVAISQIEGENLIKNLNKKELAQNLISETLSRLILNCIFTKHETYNGSMFSEYEFIGQLNYNLNYYKQKPILSLRFGLN